MKYELNDNVSIEKGTERIIDERTGALIVPARLARRGIQPYRAYELGLNDRNPNDVINVYRPDEEVFKPESLDTYSRAPVTSEHPSSFVDVKNTEQLTKGFVDSGVKQEGSFVVGNLMVTDKELINKINQGINEVSMGYTSSISFEDGVWEGQEYQAVQRDIKINHCAIVPNARAGKMCSLADSLTEGDVEMSKESKTEPTDQELFEQAREEAKEQALLQEEAEKEMEAEVKEEPVEVEKDAEEELVEESESEVEKEVDEDTETEEVEVEKDEEETEEKETEVKDSFTFNDATIEIQDAKTMAMLDAMNVALSDALNTVSELEKQLEDSIPKQNLETLVQDSIAVRTKAFALNDSIVLENKTPTEIKREVVESHYKDLTIKDSTDYVDALFDAIPVVSKSNLMDKVFTDAVPQPVKGQTVNFDAIKQNIDASKKSR